MLSLQMAIGDAKLDNFWEPLFEIISLSIEQEQRENPAARLHLQPTSNLLSMLA